MNQTLPIIISLISILLAIISLRFSIKAFRFSKQNRANDKRPFFEYSTSDGGYVNINKRIPNINLELKNTGEKAILYKIEEKTNNKIICSQLNKTIGNNALLELLIESTKILKHENLDYEIDLYLKDVDNKNYKQTIKGQGIYPSISNILETK